MLPSSFYVPFKKKKKTYKVFVTGRMLALRLQVFNMVKVMPINSHPNQEALRIK